MGQRTRLVAERLAQLGNLSLLSISSFWSENDIAETKKHFNLLRHVRLIPNQKSRVSKLFSLISPSDTDTHPFRISNEDRIYIIEKLRQYNLVWIHTVKNANLIGFHNYQNSVLDADDFPSSYCLASIRAKKNVLEKLRYGALYLFWRLKERKIQERFSSVVVCKRSDQHAFNCPSRTFVVPNTVHIKQSLYNPIHNKKMRIGLIGNFHYELNTDAIDWFLKNCWEDIRVAIPDARLRLIGKGSKSYSNPSSDIKGFGFIDDPSHEMATWSALIAPIRYGGGTSVKIVEALGRNLPVVSTSHGARGYSDYSGCPILIRNCPKDFVGACVQLLTDPTFQLKIANASRAFFEEHFETARIIGGIDMALDVALQRGSEGPDQ